MDNSAASLRGQQRSRMGNNGAASAASLDYVKFQAVIKAAASGASLRGGRASGQLDHGVEAALARPKDSQNI